MKIPENAQDRRRAALLQAIDRGDLVLRPHLMWDFVRHGGEVVLSLRWATEDGTRRPVVDEVFRFGGHYFAESARGASGPFTRLDDALVALTGEAAIPVTPRLVEIESTEWSAEEIQRRIRMAEPVAAVRVNGTLWPPADERGQA